MRTITLIRTHKDGKAVRGTLSYQMRNRDYELETFTSPTLENADFLIPAGTYPVENTWSPKFKKFLPLIKDVPDRDGIRIHKGTIPEHSKGCILVSQEKEHLLTELWLKEQQNHDETRIEICDCRRSAKGLDQSPL